MHANISLNRKNIFKCLGHQLKGQSSVELYRQILITGKQSYAFFLLFVSYRLKLVSKEIIDS